MRVHAYEESREAGNFNMRLQALVEHNALPQYSSWANIAVYLSNIEYGHLAAPQHHAFGQSSQSYNVDLTLTSSMASLTPNVVLSGYHKNCIDTALSSSITLSSAAEHRQEALAHYASKMDQNSDTCMQMFPIQLKDVAQTMRTSVGLLEQPTLHDYHGVQLRKTLPVQKPALSRQVVQSPAKAYVMKSNDDAFSITSPTSKELSSRNGRPKRALTAYNIFFKEAREQLLADRQAFGQSHLTHKDGRLGNGVRNCDAERRHKVSFEEMGKIIGKRWKKLDKAVRRIYEERAKTEKRRYHDELSEYRTIERKKMEVKFAALQASLSEETKLQYFSGRK